MSILRFFFTFQSKNCNFKGKTIFISVAFVRLLCIVYITAYYITSSYNQDIASLYPLNKCKILAAGICIINDTSRDLHSFPSQRNIRVS